MENKANNQKPEVTHRNFVRSTGAMVSGIFLAGQTLPLVGLSENMGVLQGRL